METNQPSPLRKQPSPEEWAALKEREAQKKGPQQLFARIRPNSQYADQTASGEVFPVWIDAAANWDHRVVGGPGGYYRLKDVDLLVVAGEAVLQIN